MDILERVKAITLNPEATWPVIEAEPHTPQSLFVPYFLILAAIPAVCGFIGMSVIGFGAFGISMRMPVASGLAMMVTNYIVSIAAAFALGWLISELAPKFGGEKSLMQGLKLMVFGGTPVMLAGVFSLLPALGMLSLLAALYCLYLLYLGLPVLMKNPKEKTVPYMLVLAAAGFVLAIVLLSLSSVFSPIGAMRMGSAAGPALDMGGITINTPDGKAAISITPGAAPAVAGAAGAASAADAASMTIKTPEGEVKIDVKSLEAFTKQMEDMAKQMQPAKK